MSQLTLEESARRVGSYVWVEARLFEILGGWVQRVPEAEVKVFLAEQSHHHAWHAQMWRERLPHLREMDVDALIRPGDQGWDRLISQIATPSEPVDSLEMLAAIYRVVVPRLIAAYSKHLDLCEPAADRPVKRVLDLVLTDELEDWRQGEILLQAMMESASNGTESVVRRVANRVAALEDLLVHSAGITSEHT